MFVTDHFVFLHLPKTGGVYVESVCRENLRWPVLHSRRHAPISALPQAYANLPTIGVWRNPWDWHASLYFFAQANKNEATSQIVSLASDDFKLGFEATLERLMSPDERLLKSYRERMEATGTLADIECLKPDSLERLAESGLGLMSFLAGEIFPERLDHEWRVETLRRDFFTHIKPWATDREKLRQAMTSPARNGSNKPDLRSVYTPGSARLVERHEGALIERLGYARPF